MIDRQLLVVPRSGPPYPPPDAPLPHWLDLLLCVVAPLVLTALVCGAFALARMLLPLV